MTRRNKIILLTLLVVILIALIVLVTWIVRRDATPRSARRGTESTQNGINAPQVPTAAVPAVIEPRPTGPVEQNPRVVAMDFSERYGSYSSQGDYQNLRDLLPQMTVRMQRATEALITSTPLDTSSYSGFTTRALRADVVESDETNMTFSVETQRTETSTAYPEGRTFYQTAELTLVKSDLKWLVDSFTWK